MTRSKTFKNKFTRRNRIITNYFLLALLFVSGLLYAFNINATVLHVVERKSMEKNISLIGTELGELEFAYTKEKNTLNIKTAEDLGFAEADKVVYVTRITSTVGLTINSIE